jgi:hypothetical protein
MFSILAERFAPAGRTGTPIQRTPETIEFKALCI